MMDWRQVRPCARRSRRYGNAAPRKLSWPFRLGRRTHAASSKTRPTKSSARANRNSFKRSASIMRTSRKRARKKCANYSLAPRNEIDPLLGRSFGRRSKASSPVMLEPAAMAFLHLFQPLLLFRRKKRRDLAVRFRNYVAHAPAGVTADLFQLRACLFDNRRNLGHLFIGQFELPLQTVLHRLRS